MTIKKRHTMITIPASNKLITLIIMSSLLINACGGGGSTDSDNDNDGIVNSLDVDDDNNGLIEISTLQQLDWIRNNLAGNSLNNGLSSDSNGCGAQGGCVGYELITDLDFDTNGDKSMNQDDDYYDYDGDGSNSGWLPIGSNTGQCFSGIFNGNGHRISNLFINRPAADVATNGRQIGLFRCVAGINNNSAPVAVVRDTLIDGPLLNITGESEVGILSGLVVKAAIINNHVNGNVVGTDYVGGLVGRLSRRSFSSEELIYGSSSLANVAGNRYVGGLAGQSVMSTVKASYADGSINGVDYVGGLVGRVHGPSLYIEKWGDSLIEGSFSTATVNARGNYVGGLLGYVEDTTVQACFSTARVSGNRYVGGLIGDANKKTVINYNYVLSYLDANQDVGVLVGWSDGASYLSNYFDVTAVIDDAIGYNFSSPGDVNPSGTQGSGNLKCNPDSVSVTCPASNTRYIDWETILNGHNNADTSYWDFGTADELPGLLIDGIVYRDGNGDGELDTQ